MFAFSIVARAQPVPSRGFSEWWPTRSFPMRLRATQALYGPLQARPRKNRQARPQRPCAFRMTCQPACVISLGSFDKKKTKKSPPTNQGSLKGFGAVSSCRHRWRHEESCHNLRTPKNAVSMLFASGAENSPGNQAFKRCAGAYSMRANRSRNARA
jgi:hypothetical protein